MTNAVEVKNLLFAYKEQTAKRALNDITLNLSKGESLAILGSSGAGKTTFLYCLNGIIPNMVHGQYEGTVIIHGNDVSKHTVSQMAKDIGLVFQDFENQLFSTNVRLELAFALENFSFAREKMDDIIDETLNLIGLKGLDNYAPSMLSDGQKQRLAIGSVLTSKPMVVCMDEPTTNLDPISKIEIFNIVKKICYSRETTFIIVQHEIEEVLDADRIMMMKDGKILRLDATRDVLRDISAFEACGIMPLQIPKFFHMYEGNKPSILPLTPNEGIKAFEQYNINILNDCYYDLILNDSRREKCYGEVLINVKDLCHTYPNGKMALKNINIQVRKGEFLAIVGHNGSGKTTLAKHLNGLLKPTYGSVIVCEKDTRNHSVYELGCDVGFIFQNSDHQIFNESIYDEVAFGPKLRGVSESELKTRVAEALNSVDLYGFEKEDPFTVSKSARQRTAIASVLSAKPRIIILDEPTTGLDYAGQKKIMELIKIANEKGLTVIMITHNMWVVAEYAHKVAIMHEGMMIMYDNTRNVFSKGEILHNYSLRPPQIVELSNRLNRTLLSVEEMLFCTRKTRGE